MKELGNASPRAIAAFKVANTKDDDGARMYLASYAVPNPRSFCVITGDPAVCAPSAMTPAETGDAVYSLWPAYYAGPCTWLTNYHYWLCPSFAAEAEVVVTTHLLRGQAAPMCPADPPNDGVNYTCSLGTSPIFMITVMRPEDFVSGAMAGALRSNPLLKHPSFAGCGDEHQSGALAEVHQRLQDADGDVGFHASQDGDVLSGHGGTARGWHGQIVDCRGADTDKIRLFLLEAGAGGVGELLERSGRAGLLALRSLILELNPAQRLVLRGMVRAMASGRRPTQEERRLVHYLATALKARLK